jgi:hypothetical protein
VIWYGIGGWASRRTAGRVFNADFFMYAPFLCSLFERGKLPHSAHLVTSAPFLVLNEEESSSVSGLSFASRLLLLQTYLAVSAAWYIMRGNHHALPIAEFYAATDAQLLAPARVGGASAGWTQAPGNAWPRVIQSAVRFQDEHMPKIARALRHQGMVLFCPCCCWRGEVSTSASARGYRELDGTLFVRVAGLTFDRLGSVDEGEKAGLWDLDGIPMSDVGKCAT